MNFAVTIVVGDVDELRFSVWVEFKIIKVPHNYRAKGDWRL